MNILTDLFDDNSGVSPVIGVILMVAVTVIIAAVIGSSALGLGNQISETPPQAQFSVEQVEDHTVYDELREDDIQFGTMVKIEHTSGEDVNRENIRVTVDGEPAHIATERTEDELRPEYGFPSDWDSDHPVLAEPWFDSETISSGDTAELVTAGSYLEDNGVTADPLDEDRLLYRAVGDGNHNTYDDIYALDERVDDYTLEEGQTVRVIWESGDQSQTLLEKEI